MSGGSWNYIYNEFDSVATRLKESHKINRRTLGKLIAKIAIAMKEIEWEDSGDSEGADSAIDDVLKFKVDKAIKFDVENYILELRELIK